MYHWQMGAVQVVMSLKLELRRRLRCKWRRTGVGESLAGSTVGCRCKITLGLSISSIIHINPCEQNHFRSDLDLWAQESLQESFPNTLQEVPSSLYCKIILRIFYLVLLFYYGLLMFIGWLFCLMFSVFMYFWDLAVRCVDFVFHPDSMLRWTISASTTSQQGQDGAGGVCRRLGISFVKSLSKLAFIYFLLNEGLILNLTGRYATTVSCAGRRSIREGAAAWWFSAFPTAEGCFPRTDHAVFTAGSKQINRSKERRNQKSWLMFD